MIIPEFINFIDWANSLIIDFPSENIPLISDENDWKSWGDFISSLDTFSKQNAPGTAAYQDKWTWAKDLYYVMAPLYA